MPVGVWTWLLAAGPELLACLSRAVTGLSVAQVGDRQLFDGF